MLATALLLGLTGLAGAFVLYLTARRLKTSTARAHAKAR